MKEYIRAFRVFGANTAFKNSVAGALVSFSAFAVMKLLDIIFSLGSVESDFLRGFFEGFYPAFMVVVPVLGAVVVNTVASACNPVSQGYKYLHSIADGAKCFKRAMIVATLYALLINILWSGVVTIICCLSGNFVPAVCCPMLGAGLLGAVNLAAFVKNAIVRIASFMPIMLGVGFVMGFASVAKEDGGEPEWLMLAILGAVCLAMLIGGIINIVVNAEKKWYAKD